MFVLINNVDNGKNKEKTLHTDGLSQGLKVFAVRRQC